MFQTYLKINDVNLPVIVEDNIKYYPISYMAVNVLRRSGKNAFIGKHNKDNYKDYIREFEVEFYTPVGNQNHKTKCISEEGLKIALSKTKVGKLSIEQRKCQNYLHEELGIDLLAVRQLYINELSNEQINEHEEYVREIIEYEIENSNIDNFHLCPKCDKYYPMTNRFFRVNVRTNTGFHSVCIVCTGKLEVFQHPNKDKESARKQGMGIYEAMKNDSIIEVYNAYLQGKLKRLPDCYENKDGYLRIIHHLYNTQIINENNLTVRFLRNECKLKYINNHLKIEDVFSHLFGDDFYYYRWKYPTYNFTGIELTYDIINKILKNYITENDIKIGNIFTYDYYELIKKAKVRKAAESDLLYFIVQFYNFEYPGYMFRCGGINYYKNDDNLKFDLKYLIEKDMKLEASKVPLYLTKNVLQKKCRPLYNQIVSNKNHNLFYWVDQLYPNTFIETDFEINAYRSEFDSDTECFIHEILTNRFRSVIYNQKHTDRTIIISGMIPDWLVFTDKGVWIVEYFGMYIKRQYNASSRIQDYINKTHEKIEKYNNVKGYNFIFLYPEDIDNDFKGCREKLRQIEESQ